MISIDIISIVIIDFIIFIPSGKNITILREKNFHHKLYWPIREQSRVQRLRPKRSTNGEILVSHQSAMRGKRSCLRSDQT